MPSPETVRNVNTLTPKAKDRRFLRCIRSRFLPNSRGDRRQPLETKKKKRKRNKDRKEPVAMSDLFKNSSPVPRAIPGDPLTV